MSKPNCGIAAQAPPLVLGSGSPYRRALLERLGLAFESLSPDCDESRRQDEPPARLARRLADEKCAAVARRRPHAVVIASDQLACRGETILGKPGTAEKAMTQLRESSGQEVAFLTAVSIRIPSRDDLLRHTDVTRVVFRNLCEDAIARYVKSEEPLDCAGSFKCEGLGITLFERIISIDPTALTGLPLIWTAASLRTAGFALP